MEKSENGFAAKIVANPSDLKLLINEPILSIVGEIEEFPFKVGDFIKDEDGLINIETQYVGFYRVRSINTPLPHNTMTIVDSESIEYHFMPPEIFEKASEDEIEKAKIAQPEYVEHWYFPQHFNLFVSDKEWKDGYGTIDYYENAQNFDEDE